MAAIDTILSTILSSAPVTRSDGFEIGRSREERPIRAFRVGSGAQRVSLIGGCHADEPVGPRLLRHLVSYLGALPQDHPLVRDRQWWVIPHLNPDGEERNRVWYGDDDTHYDPIRYLRGVVRELPGDDIEFGFPRDVDDDGARPENRAACDWWRSAGGPFALHVTLHGMAIAAGPWFLIEEAWRDRSPPLRERCRARVRELGYVLHDVERHGEKGFQRIERGFCTRPDSRAMQQFFRDRDDEDMASRFRPSSMETHRSFGGDPLTLVSEMPLFITPGVGDDLGPPDPVAEMWKQRISTWMGSLTLGDDPVAVAAQVESSGLHPMPIAHQMDLQWTFITAGLELAV